MQHPCHLLPFASIVIAAFAVATSPAASAQYSSDFDSLNASGSGTLLTGQDSYYIPPGTTSVDFDVFSYAGNTLGLPQNPSGGTQFVAGTGPASPTFARAQRDMTYGSGVWTAAYDIAATFTGVLPTAQNAGSFSIQPFPGSQAFIALARWTDPMTAANWDADYVWFDSTGTQVTEHVGNVGFQNLDVDKWYRWETDFDLGTNEIIEVRLTDIAAGTTVIDNPIGRYLEGGPAGSATPTGFRFFGGGGVDGNTLAFDNISIEQASGSIGMRYCTPAVPNASGSPTSLTVSGSAIVANNDVTLTATDMPASTFGFFITSQSQGFVANPGGSQGNLCLGGSIGRYVGPGQVQNSGATGSIQLMLDLTMTPTPTGLVAVMPGDTWSFQCWHRDSVGGVATSNFSDGVTVGF